MTVIHPIVPPQIEVAMRMVDSLRPRYEGDTSDHDWDGLKKAAQFAIVRFMSGEESYSFQYLVGEKEDECDAPGSVSARGHGGSEGPMQEQCGSPECS